MSGLGAPIVFGDGPARASVGPECLSPYHPAPLAIDGVRYDSVEQWLETKRPGLTDRSVSRREVALVGNLAKFSQHPTLARYLGATGSRPLAYRGNSALGGESSVLGGENLCGRVLADTRAMLRTPELRPGDPTASLDLLCVVRRWEHTVASQRLSGKALSELNTVAPLAAAQAYAARGWPVMPLAWMAGGACACRAKGSCAHPAKHPLNRNGVRGASSDPEQIQQWWSAWPKAGIGLATGARSSLVVIDVDAAHGGDRTLESLAATKKLEPDTLTATTGGGGRHLLYVHPGAPHRVGNPAGRLPGIGTTPGVDMRGDGGYIVVAPSIHASGHQYRWEETSPPPAPTPPWVVAVEAPRRPAAALRLAPGASEELGAYADAVLRAEVGRVAQATQGQRNVELNRAAFALGTLVGAGVLDGAEAALHLSAAARRQGLSDTEAQKTIARSLAQGASRPRDMTGVLAQRRSRREAVASAVQNPTRGIGGLR